MPAAVYAHRSSFMGGLLLLQTASPPEGMFMILILSGPFVISLDVVGVAVLVFVCRRLLLMVARLNPIAIGATKF